MKKILFMFAAVAIAAVSCTKEVMDHNDLNDQKNGPKSDIEFTAGLEVATKTALDGTNTLWVAGDEISVNGAKFVTEDAGETATFYTTETFAAAASYSAVYPYSAGTSFTAVTVPATQTVTAGSYDPKATVAVAVSETHDLNFKNVTALLKFQVSASATEVTIESDEVLAGKVKVDYNNGQPTYEVVEGVKTVTVKGTFETGKSYYVAVLPSATHTFKVSVDQNLSKQSTKDSEVLRGYIMNMGTLQVSAPLATMAYKIKQIWVYGGTGPEYGSAAWIDIYKKTWWFDPSTGHGITAELDNYFELTVTSMDGTTAAGKCTNWAGKDEKNWDCWFYNTKKDDGTYRIPAGNKDANSFYRQIPIGVSTWVRDYAENTMTFTDSEGNQTVLKVYEATDPVKFVPGYNDSKADYNSRYFPGCYKEGESAVDGMDMTLHAKVKGTNNWASDRNYELDRIYDNPRDVFFDFEQVESVPEEAKTSEPKYTPVFPEEEEPETPETLTTLAGTYKYSTDFTVGGKDGSITVKGLTDQYATWEPAASKVKLMKNDKYTFTPTGTDANGNETGTVTFDDGGDGTWDFSVYDNTNNNKMYDATELYCFIAQDNTSTYVYDAEAGQITFKTRGKEMVVDYLVPGTYTYSTKAVTVPASATFAMHYDMGYTEARISGYTNPNNGCARHYVWARDWVLCLVKQ